jgi:hypothetical protein
MPKTILGLLLLSLSAEGATNCVGCTNFGPIQGLPGYELQYGAKMVWTVDGLDSGLYVVDLTFVETVYKATGQRPMNVWVNDGVALSGFDIFAAGGFTAPVVRSFVAPVNDGKLVVVLTASPTGLLGTKHTAVLSRLNWTRVPSGSGPSSPDDFSGQLKVTRASPSQLNIASGNIGIGGISYKILAGVAGCSAGSGALRIAITSGPTPYGQVYADPGLTATCAGMNGCTAPIASSQFAPGDMQLATWTCTAGTLDTNGGTDLRYLLSTGTVIVPTTGLQSVISGHQMQISVPQP